MKVNIANFKGCRRALANMQLCLKTLSSLLKDMPLISQFVCRDLSFELVAPAFEIKQIDDSAKLTSYFLSIQVPAR